MKKPLVRDPPNNGSPMKKPIQNQRFLYHFPALGLLPSWQFKLGQGTPRSLGARDCGQKGGPLQGISVDDGNFAWHYIPEL